MTMFFSSQIDALFIAAHIMLVFGKDKVVEYHFTNLLEINLETMVG